MRPEFLQNDVTLEHVLKLKKIINHFDYTGKIFVLNTKYVIPYLINPTIKFITIYRIDNVTMPSYGNTFALKSTQSTSYLIIPFKSDIINDETIVHKDFFSEEYTFYSTNIKTIMDVLKKELRKRLQTYSNKWYNNEKANELKKRILERVELKYIKRNIPNAFGSLKTMMEKAEEEWEKT